MQGKMDFAREVFSIRNEEKFNTIALKIFNHQFNFNKIYREFIDSAGISVTGITDFRDIPFMPVEFFKTHTIITGDDITGKIFLSSGTTGTVQSRHMITGLAV